MVVVAQVIRTLALVVGSTATQRAETSRTKEKVDRWRPLQGGGGPPHNGEMKSRAIKLEDFAQDTRDRLARIESKLDTFATKADLQELRSEIHKGNNELIRWVVGTAVGLGVAAITVTTFVLNNATPKAPAAAPQAPIIIHMPAAAAAPLPPPAKP